MRKPVPPNISAQPLRAHRTVGQIMRTALVVTWVLCNVGCGKPVASSADEAHAAQLARAILDLKSGRTIKALNLEAAEPSPWGLSDASAMLDTSPASRLTRAPTPWLDDDASTPEFCSLVLNPAPGAAEAVWQATLVDLGVCLRQALRPAEVARILLTYEMTYARNTTEKPLSKMSDLEAESFVVRPYVAPGKLAGLTDAEAPLRLRLRNRFEDQDLDELALLADHVQEKLTLAESAFFELVDTHRPLLEHFAIKNNRYRLLLLLRDAAREGRDAATLGKQVADLIAASGMKVPRDLAAFPSQMLRPWAIRAISPDDQYELSPLREPLENPFVEIQHVMAQFGGPPSLRAQQRRHYVQLRDADNPPLPSHAPPHPQAVRIAIADTGIDFVNFPELGEFLSDGLNGAMNSYDFQDNDNNPYLAATGMDGHGTGSVASVLTILSHYAPEVLATRKIDLAVWKLDTVRNHLAAPYLGITNWESREALAEAIIRVAMDPKIELKPQIVSISEIFQFQEFLENSQHPDALVKAPWLWIMAAGNEGVESDQDKTPVCLSDVPDSQKVEARILCVGALRRGVLDDKIAGYSNYGDRVDLYAYESYIDLCSGGTSCSTPAISGAAVAVAARYPDFTPEEIKSVLMAAAETRTLDVDLSTAPASSTLDMPLAKTHQPMTRKSNAEAEAPLGLRSLFSVIVPDLAQPRRTVQVLDPSTMMPRIWKAAAWRAKHRLAD